MFETAMFLELMEKLRDKCHQNSKDKGFWGNNPDGSTVSTDPFEKESPWNFGEKIALIHSELSEMFEAWRKGVGDEPCDKDVRVIDPGKVTSEGYPATRQITAIEEEFADIVIRLMDLAGKLDIDVGRVVLAKMEYNTKRPYMHGGRKC